MFFKGRRQRRPFFFDRRRPSSSPNRSSRGDEALTKPGKDALESRTSTNCPGVLVGAVPD